MEKFDVTYLLQPQTIINSLVELQPVPHFLRDRYAPKAGDNVFATNNVLVEIKNGDRTIAPYVMKSADGVIFDRGGYRMHEYEPATTAVGRILTLDDLQHRGFGEAPFANVTAEQRAAMLIAEDAADLDEKIWRLEEQAVADVLLNNSFTIKETIDGKTDTGEVKKLCFYDFEDESTGKKNPSTLTLTKSWDTTEESGKQIVSDLHQMILMLTTHGRPATEVLVSMDVANILINNVYIQEMLDNRRIEIGGISPEELAPYPEVAKLGRLNIYGHYLDIIVYEGTYEDAEGNTVPFLPEGTAIVTAPNCIRFNYGKIEQMEADEQWHTYTQPRVPRVFTDVRNSMRQLEIRSRFIPVPKVYCPAVYAKVTGVE